MAVIAPQTEQTETRPDRVPDRPAQTGDRRRPRPVRPVPGRPRQTQAGPQGLFAFLDAADVALDAIDPSCLSVEDAAECAPPADPPRAEGGGPQDGLVRPSGQGSLYTRTGHRSAAEFLAATTGDSSARQRT